jgi:phosphatidylserine synthase
MRHRIDPIFERIQTLPVRLLARLPRWMRVCIYAIACVVWTVLFGVIITNYSLPTNFAGFGSPVGLSCVASLWYVPVQYCVAI